VLKILNEIHLYYLSNPKKKAIEKKSNGLLWMHEPPKFKKENLEGKKG